MFRAYKNYLSDETPFNARYLSSILSCITDKNKLYSRNERFVFVSRSRVPQHREYQIDRNVCVEPLKCLVYGRSLRKITVTQNVTEWPVVAHVRDSINKLMLLYI